MTPFILEIQEMTGPKTKRTRRIRVDSESITLGNQGEEDILLTAIGESFAVEIKWSEDQWWILNPHRSNQIRVNGKLVEFDSPLHQDAQILLAEHLVSFRLENPPASLSKDRFVFKEGFRSDQELWNYLLSEKEFDEILINGPLQIYVDYQGNLLQSPWRFSSPQFLEDRIREKSSKTDSWVSWQMDRSLRIQAALPPLVESPHLCIRKARPHVFSLPELEEKEFGSPEQIRILREAIKNRESVLISGGTSTGKTVLLRSLVEQVPHTQRLVVVEEEAETNWPHPHAVAIEAGRGRLEATVKECLRFRPDRLIISEIRGAEAFDFLQAINTGHEGSMSSIHANSPREALHRIENLILGSGLAVHAESIRAQLSQAVQLVVQLKRESNGRRRIDEISRITGIQQGTILMGDPTYQESSGIKSEVKRIR
jgi:Flp pilus assembly CpaF family ATPase